MGVERIADTYASLWIYRVLSYSFAFLTLSFAVWFLFSKPFPLLSSEILAFFPHAHALLLIGAAVCVLLLLNFWQRSSMALSISILLLSLLMIFFEFFLSFNPIRGYASIASMQNGYYSISGILTIVAAGLVLLSRKKWLPITSTLFVLLILVLFAGSYAIYSMNTHPFGTLPLLTLMVAALLCLLVERGRAHLAFFAQYAPYLLGICLVISLAALCWKLYILEEQQGVQYHLLTWLFGISGLGVILLLIGMLHSWNRTLTREQILRHQSVYDPLTNLPNRSMVLDLIDHAFHTNTPPKKVAILILDIDRMSIINDIFGHTKGDEVIKTVAQRIQANLPKNSHVCRMGSDEFALIVNQITETFAFKKSIERFLSNISQPISLQETCFNITFSIGIALSPNHSLIKEELFRMADIALVEAKKMGRNSISMYSSQFNAYTLQKIHLENDLYMALKEKRFVLLYQPVFQLDNHQLTAVEALIRWRHPKRGLLLPDVFIPIAEEINLIHPISEWVLWEACEQLTRWQNQGFKNLKMAVNIAAPQFQEHKLLNTIYRIINHFSLLPQSLELELTERTLLDENPAVCSTLNALDQQGFCLTLDDFGTGYSSLSYLKRFPIRKLKIDKSFIFDLISSEENQKLVKAIISMAKSLKMQVLAEGIENRQQYDFLKKNGCDLGQGFYLAHPMSARDCTQFFEKAWQPAIILRQH